MIICYLIYSTILNILSKCDMYQYFTLGLNILVNVYNIFYHFAAYNIFMLNCRFKQPGQLIGREHMLFPCMQRVCIIVITTWVTKCSFFGCFIHTITRVSIWWIYDSSGSDINQMPCLTHWGRYKMTTILHIIYKSLIFLPTTKQLLQVVPKGAVEYKWFRQWLGSEQTPSHYLSQWWTGSMVHIRVSRIDWVDNFTVLGKIYRCREKNGTIWAHEGYLHPHIAESGQCRPARSGSGWGTGWPWFVTSPIRGPVSV